MESPQRNLALDLVRVTEVAALASARWLGKGAKKEGDAAAVDAMRLSFNALEIDGTVIIGEGQKDQAPMLFNGEKLGSGRGPQVDVAVDPVEGTNLLALGRPNAISVVGVSPAGTMFDPGPSYYMQKLVVPAAARERIDLDAPVEENLRNVARALGKDVDDLVVFVLDKPRHRELIARIRQAGARIQLHTDGDVAGALMAVDPNSVVNVMMGTGGTPEGVLDVRRLVASEDVFFAATGISGGTFLRGVDFTGSGAVTHSLVLRAKTGTVRYIESHHNWSKLMRFSAVKFD